MHVPPKSPDLNPVEMYWSWVRRTLCRMDLVDLQKKRPVPGKFQYKQRVTKLLKSKKAQEVARNCFLRLQKHAKLVSKRQGKASARG